MSCRLVAQGLGTMLLRGRCMRHEVTLDLGQAVRIAVSFNDGWG